MTNLQAIPSNGARSQRRCDSCVSTPRTTLIPRTRTSRASIAPLLHPKRHIKWTIRITPCSGPTKRCLGITIVQVCKRRSARRYVLSAVSPPTAEEQLTMIWSHLQRSKIMGSTMSLLQQATRRTRIHVTELHGDTTTRMHLGAP